LEESSFGPIGRAAFESRPVPTSRAVRQQDGSHPIDALEAGESGSVGVMCADKEPCPRIARADSAGLFTWRDRVFVPDGMTIHGTSSPSDRGNAVSHGCVRVYNEDLKSLLDVPLGTPVEITTQSSPLFPPRGRKVEGNAGNDGG
jgi:lipoprotein-anchoring transpeptidase ErfK/SrfK